MTTPQPPEQQLPAHGFGSFATERDEDRIDVLIALPPDQYKPPHIPVSVDLSTYPLPTSPFGDSPGVDRCNDNNSVPFGRPTLTSWYHIDPVWTFLNHGAFGATFKPVSDAEILWHRYMESQPLRFIDRKLLPLLVYTTRRLAQFINAPATDLVILPNVTNGLNTILNSIDWYHVPPTHTASSDSPEQSQPTLVSQTSLTTVTTTTITTLPTYVVTFDTGYGATKQMIKSVKDKFGNHIIHQDLHLTFPISSPKEITQLLRNALKKHEKAKTIGQVKLVIVDYIQSNAGLVFPIEELCGICHTYGIPIMIDGAHALGSFNLDIGAMKHKPTFFVANAHKWLCSGKGVSMLYVNPDLYPHTKIKPAVVSHGYSSTTLAGKFLWVGLQDYSHYLALNTALDCWEKIGVATIRNYLTTMLRQATDYLTNEWNTDLLGPNEMFAMMACVRLPGPRVPQSGQEHTDLQDALYFRYQIEAPIKMLQNRLYIRISCHIYNDFADFKNLSRAMLELRPKLVGDDDEKDIEFAENAQDVVPFTSCG